MLCRRTRHTAEMRYCKELIVFFVIIVESCGFMLNSSNASKNQGNGQCVWYGQCGSGFNPNTHLNCPVTDKTRDGPYLNGSRGLDIVKRLCPDLYKGDKNTRTCCSESQLIEMDANMALARQLLPRCPSCLRNFLNYFCQLTCGLNQAQFVWPDMSHPYPPGYLNPKGIPAVTVLLTNHYATKFYNSCKNVEMPSFNDKAISMFCGRSATDCTAYKLFSYMGNIDNGQAAFPIKYIFQDKPWVSPDGKLLTPLNATVIPCNQSVSNTSKPCKCQDCIERCGMVPCPTGQPRFSREYFAPLHHSQKIRRLQLVIYRPNNNTKIPHSYPPPAADSINFTSIFDREFMHEVLDFQANVTDLNVSSTSGETFSFDDICYKPDLSDSGGCAVESVLQYWQNNGTNVDKIAWDQWHIFNLADYLDHFLNCAIFPYGVTDVTKLNMSCRADYGAVMKPMNVLGGYQSDYYNNATSFVLSFYLNTRNEEQNDKADLWEEKMEEYIINYPTKDMAICFWP